MIPAVHDAGHRGWVLVLIGAIACHAALALAFVGRLWVTTAGTTIVLAVMTAYCATRARDPIPDMRWRWIMMGIAMALWAAAFWAIQWVMATYGDGPRIYFDYFFYLLRLTPYLLILASAGHADEGRVYRAIDIAQALLLTGLLFYLIHPALFPAGSLPGEDWNTRLSLYHKSGNLLIAALALIAIPAQSGLARRRFSVALASLLTSYALLSFALTNLVFHSAHPTPPGHVVNALIGLPFLLFLLVDTAPGGDSPRRRRSILIGMLMPTAFCGAAMAVAFAIGTLESAIAAGVALLLMGARAARLQSDLFRLERFVAGLVDHLPDAVCVVGADGVVKSANSAATRLFGSASVGGIFAPLRRALGTVNERDGTIETGRGGTFAVAEATLEDGDRVVRLTDITALRATEREREDALQLLGHDIRSPYAAILTLLGQPGAENDPDALGRHARHGLAIADDFVRLARARTAALVLEPVDLVDAVAEAVDLASTNARARAIALEDVGDAPEDGVWVDGDRGLLIRAIHNLLGNGVRFAAPGTAVRYGTHVVDGRADLTVTSTGPELPPDRRADPFARFGGHADRVGLGLALVHVASERHGGTAMYERRGGDNAFSIHIPLSTLVRP